MEKRQRAVKQVNKLTNTQTNFLSRAHGTNNGACARACIHNHLHILTHTLTNICMHAHTPIFYTHTDTYTRIHTHTYFQLDVLLNCWDMRARDYLFIARVFATIWLIFELCLYLSQLIARHPRLFRLLRTYYLLIFRYYLNLVFCRFSDRTIVNFSIPHSTRYLDYDLIWKFRLLKIVQSLIFLSRIAQYI